MKIVLPIEELFALSKHTHKKHTKKKLVCAKYPAA